MDATRSVALLGPTNTGKTHRAVERMLEHPSGMIGLPLRLLAREIYDRVSARIGQERVALITGEEKRVPRRADYWVCTTEAMPLTHEVDFLAVDEVQLATHDERGHVFTERLLHARGRRESWFLGASTMRPLMERLVPAARQEQHPRLSSLSFAGSSKLAKLKPRSAVVAFSVAELYEIAERLKSLRGGAAVVLGALSPRARNAQVAMFQAGEVDYLVATDAIGMGLNLDVDHVAFASLRKFDGRAARELSDAEFAQIAGRAGRYLRDGSFGTVAPLELDRALAQRIEQHRFDAVRRVRWRNSELDFTSASALVDSLRVPPPAAHFSSVPDAEDERALRALLGDPLVVDRAATRLLWEVCQIPDFRGILFEVHVALLKEIFLALCQGPLESDFMAAHFAELDRTDGDRHTLVARIARLRTWAFVANQGSWLREREHWQERLRDLEDRLSDALHSALCDSFVTRRGKGRRTPRAAHESSPGPAGSHPFAALSALRGKLDGAADPDPERALEALVDAPHEAFSVDRQGQVWAGERRLGKLTRGPSLLLPEFKLLGLADSGAGLRARLSRRLFAFGRDIASRLLEPVRALSAADSAALRAVAYQLEQQLGTAPLSDLEPLLTSLDDALRHELEQSGIVIGQVVVYLPALLAPQALALRATLLSVFDARARLPEPLGRPSYPARGLSESAWRTLGYVVVGPRAVRCDLLERAASEIRARAAPARALRSLGVPRPELLRVARSLSDRLAETP